MRKFVHLHTHSHYSLLDGLAKIDELVGYAKELGMPALALTDHGNVYGAIEFFKKAKAAGIKPILGIEAYVAPRSRREKIHGIDNKYFHLTLLCRNNEGWQNMIQLVTKSNLEGFYYKPRIDKELLCQHSEGLIALSGCYSGEVIKNLLKDNFDGAEKVVLEHKEIFGEENYYIEVGHHPGIDPNNFQKIRAGLIELARKTGTPLVATQDIHYLKTEDAPYHNILLSVQASNKWSGDNKRVLSDDFSMKSAEAMVENFKDIPEAVENTLRIAGICNVEIELGKIILPKFPLPNGESPFSFLKKLTEKKAGERYPEITKEIRARIDYELEVVNNMGFADYFLIVQDFINWAKSRGIVVGPGRGSAAGSIVSYIIGITNVDPLKFGLLFERFLNPDRIQMPDIDVDLADQRRNEVLGYLQEKYGREHIANIITFGTMAARAAVRDAGRALGMNYSLCDRIAKLIPFNQNLESSLANIKELKDFYENNADAKKIIDAAKHLEGVARHASVHACGIVIGEKPLTNYLPLQYAPQDDNTIVTQFEMHAVEDLGLLKMDLLGLKNLTILEEAVRLVRESGKGEVDIDNLPPNDQKTFTMLQNGDTAGVFQFESSGMRRYMKDLIPTELEDLVALVAAYRPGPMELIPSFIKRKHRQEEIIYLHPGLEPIMKNTYGIGIYQEQMMRIARDLAGFTLAEADTLRKAIGKKIKSLLDQQKEKLINGMITNGIEEKVAKAIWELFPPFARYGFNKSHAVCYATIGYQTAYLKAHYPVEFMTGLFNSDSGDIERIAFLVNESKKMDIAILPPDINKSWLDFVPEEKTIRFGLLAIKNVGYNIVEAIVANRQSQGPFSGISNFLKRIHHKDLNKKSLESLIKCGALDCLGVERNQALGNIDNILRFNGAIKKYQKSSQIGLFGNGFSGELQLAKTEQADAKTRLMWEKELLGLYISDHPLNSHREKLIKTKTIKDALTIKSERVYFDIGGLITKVQKIITKTGKPMAFVKIEDFNDEIEAVIFPDVFEKNISLWNEGRTLLVSGRMSWRNSEPRFICDSAKSL